MYAEGLFESRQVLKCRHITALPLSLIGAGSAMGAANVQVLLCVVGVAGISLEGVAKLKPAHDFYDKVPHIPRVPAE